MRIDITTRSEQDTIDLGQRLGSLLRGGEVVELSADLGGGKTTLTKGIAVGTGSGDIVSSPTFTISNQYQGDTLVVHHYDFYRLDQIGIMKDEIVEAMSDPGVVSIVEWAGEAHELFDVERLVRIAIVPDAHDENTRHVSIETLSDELASRLQGIGERA